MEGKDKGKSETGVREAGARGIQVERYPQCINKPTYQRPSRNSSSLERFSTSESALTQLLASYSYNTDTTLPALCEGIHIHYSTVYGYMKRQRMYVNNYHAIIPIVLIKLLFPQLYG